MVTKAGDLLLLQVVLPRAPRLAPGEWTLVTLLAGVHSSMAGEMAAGREDVVARAADELLFGQRVLDHRHDLGLLAVGHVAGGEGVVTGQRVGRFICCGGTLLGGSFSRHMGWETR